MLIDLIAEVTFITTIPFVDLGASVVLVKMLLVLINNYGKIIEHVS